MEKIWLKQYPEYIPEFIDESTLKPLNQMIEEANKKFASNVAFSCMGKSLTYQETKDLSDKLASYFINNLNLAKGSKVALMMPNILQYPVCLHAALKAGLTVVNVNPLYTPRELEHQLNDSEASTIIILENFAHVFEKVQDKTPIKNVIITSLADLLPSPKRQLIHFVVRYLKKMVPKYSLNNSVEFLETLKIGSQKSFVPPKVSLSDIAFLQYTGGTTGVSKGAVLTHRNISANISQAKAWIGKNLKEGRESIVTALPLYHIFSLTANCLTFMSLGAHNILITNPRDIKGFIKILKNSSFSVITGVNTLFNALLNADGFDTIDFSKLKVTLGGGMAVQKAVAKNVTMR